MNRPMEWTELSKAYLKNCLPAVREEIATSGKMKTLEYLKPISKETTQVHNIDVGSWDTCWCKLYEALKSMEIIPSRNTGLYGYRTKLRWCIVGPITNSRKDGSVKCHGIAVKDFPSGKKTIHHFVLDGKPKTEDIGMEEVLKGMYYSTFCKSLHLQVNSALGSIEKISRKDKKFLDVFETGTKKDGEHYEVLVPFRDTGV